MRRQSGLFITVGLKDRCLCVTRAETSQLTEAARVVGPNCAYTNSRDWFNNHPWMVAGTKRHDRSFSIIMARGDVLISRYKSRGLPPRMWQSNTSSTLHRSHTFHFLHSILQHHHQHVIQACRPHHRLRSPSRRLCCQKVRGLRLLCRHRLSQSRSRGWPTFHQDRCLRPRLYSRHIRDSQGQAEHRSKRHHLQRRGHDATCG